VAYFKVSLIYQNLPGQIEENHGKLQGSWSPEKYSNTGLSEYKAGVI
jgi:hypothetical protein